jgi:hypothetical protein
MIVTTIKLIGLLVTTMLTSPNPPGVQVIMGNFAPTLPPHTQLIAWPKGTRVALPPSEEWPTNGGFTAKDGVDYEYSLVTVQNVTLTGPTEPFNLALDKIPHLTCCCAQFVSGFNPQWGNPAYSGPGQKKSAFFTLTHGTYTTVPESSGAISTALGITDNVDITFEGVIGGSVKKIKLHPPQPPSGTYVVFVANTPLAVLEGKPVHNPGNDFQNYYKMGIGTEGTCTASPSTPGPCAPSTNACGRDVVAQSKGSKVRKIVQQIRRVLKPLTMVVDADCSSSQWP